MGLMVLRARAQAEGVVPATIEELKGADFDRCADTGKPCPMAKVIIFACDKAACMLACAKDPERPYISAETAAACTVQL